MSNEIKKLQERFKKQVEMISTLKVGDIVAHDNTNAMNARPCVVLAIDTEAAFGDLRTIVLGFFDFDGNFETCWAAPYNLTILVPFTE